MTLTLPPRRETDTNADTDSPTATRVRRPGLTERLVNRLAGRPKPGDDGSVTAPRPNRRDLLGGAALVGAAMAVSPWGYLVRPAAAYDVACGLDSECNQGYSVFCCTINSGLNLCPPNTFIGGWWKADNSSFCGGSARYYLDCNAYRDQNFWQCRCNDTSCDRRRVACTQFRYGQCNVDVPAARSGTVVCRLVSCIPPYQQYAGICTAASATDNRTVTHTAPCVGRPPIGTVDDVVDASDRDTSAFRVTGWTFDPDLANRALDVAVYIDSVGVSWFPSGISRPDVNAAYGITGDHGFDLVIAADPGLHTVDVFAIDGSGNTVNPLLASRTVLVDDPARWRPIGVLDQVTSAPDGTLRVTGWAFDPDDPDQEIQVAVYRDDIGVSWFPTGEPRGDVNQVFANHGDHGFDIAVSASPGDHTVTVFGINIGRGDLNPVIGSASIRSAGFPTGALDVVRGVPGALRIAGWAFDPDDPETEIQIAVYRDGIGVSWFPTGKARPDVNAAFRLTGKHGYELDIPTAPGSHDVTVFAINVGQSAPNIPIGTRSAVVPG